MINDKELKKLLKNDYQKKWRRTYIDSSKKYSNLPKNHTPDVYDTMSENKERFNKGLNWED